MAVTIFIDTVTSDILVKLLYAVLKEQYSVFLIPDILFYFFNVEIYFHLFMVE